jgi:hypothetical protein
MPIADEPSPAPPVATRDELIDMITRAHLESAYGASSVAGERLAAQSRLPKVIAVNLGAGFGQWEFFPDVSEIVDFACAYVPPESEEELLALARTWASDDAGGRHTLMALVGRDILQHELRRIDVPALRELFDEVRPARALVLRAALGLAVPPSAPPKVSKARERKAPAPKPAPAPKEPTPTRMPKPVFVRPASRAPEPPARRFVHPTFGEGLLERQDGSGTESKLTIRFEGGSKTLLARFVTELPRE